MLTPLEGQGRKSGVDEYIAELRQGAGDAPVRRFTIDRGLAREKLARFRLSEPHQYVTELLQAAVASGATRVDVDLDADDVWIRFDGRGFTRQDFELLYEPSDAEDDPAVAVARKQLGLGLTLALAVRPKYIRVVSSGPDGSAELEIAPDQADRFDEREQACEGTSIHLRRPLSPRLVAKAAQKVLGTLPEERLIRERCRFGPVEITLNGESVVQPDALPAVETRVELEGPDFCGVVGFVPFGDRPGEVRVVRHGVLVDTLEGELAGPQGLLAVVRADGVQRDLSLEKIQQDDAFKGLLQTLQRSRDRSLEKVVLALEAEDDGEPAPRWMKRVVRLALLRGYLPEGSRARELDLWQCFEGKAEPRIVSLAWIERKQQMGPAMEYVTADDLLQHARRVRRRSRCCLVVQERGEWAALRERFGVVLVPLNLASVYRSLSPVGRFFVWCTVLGIVAAVAAGALLYVESHGPDRATMRSSRLTPDDDERCGEGDVDACLRRGDQLLGTGRLTCVAPAQRNYRAACNLGRERGCVEAAALRGLAQVRVSKSGRRHWLLTRACNGWQLRACRLAAVLFPRLSQAERERVQTDDVADCKRNGRRLTCFRAGLRWLVGYGVRPRRRAGRSKLGYVCRQQLTVACSVVDAKPGSDIRPEPEEAWAGAYLEGACAAGNLHGCAQLSELVRLGRGAPRNDARAQKLATRACKGGVAQACGRVCQRYKVGCAAKTGRMGSP